MHCSELAQRLHGDFGKPILDPGCHVVLIRHPQFMHRTNEGRALFNVQSQTVNYISFSFHGESDEQSVVVPKTERAEH